ncbi:MAG: hypothetical protein RLZZ618_3291 [Pseudomonadota bacterium]|jgi:hypothetical protein
MMDTDEQSAAAGANTMIVGMVQALSSSVSAEGGKGSSLRANPGFHAAFQRLFILARSNPRDALEVIYLVCCHHDDPWTLDLLASGPLETVMRNADADLQSLISVYASGCSAFASLLDDGP